MEAHELAEKFRNAKQTREGFEEVVAWCHENAGSLDLTNQDHQYLYEMATRYLMKIKIGHWNKDDANVAINYLAKREAWKLGIDENITIKILEEAEYNKMHGDNSGKAICIDNGDDTFDISYSQTVVKHLTGNDLDAFLRGLQTVFHEIAHTMQNTKIHKTEINGEKVEYSGNTYRMTLETIMRRVHPKFYNENYSHLLKENQAEYLGLEQAVRTIQRYNPQLYRAVDQDKIARKMKEYEKECYWENGEVAFGGENINGMALLNFACTHYIQERPEILGAFPVLQSAFNLDGTRKGIIQLIEDRQSIINGGKRYENLDDLYRTIANYRNIEKGEMVELYDYITKTGTDDEFVFDLLQYRLGKTNWSQEKVEKFMQETRDEAAKIREERGTRELEPEEQESIKDEVGDELKPKTEAQKQEEQHLDTMWQNRLQSWDRDAINLPNSATREQQAARAISDAVKNKEQDAKDKEEESQAPNDPR